MKAHLPRRMILLELYRFCNVSSGSNGDAFAVFEAVDFAFFADFYSCTPDSAGVDTVDFDIVTLNHRGIESCAGQIEQFLFPAWTNKDVSAHDTVGPASGDRWD